MERSARFRRQRALATWLAITVLASAAGAQTISVVSNLSFGNVFPSVPKVISKNAAGAAAEFHVSGTAGAEVEITFLFLPTYLNQSGFTLSVLFSNTDCAMDSSATPNQSNPGYDNLNPWQPITYRLGMNGLTIWLGATAIPSIGQKPGSYSGPIQVRVQYTGN
ncbi:hypothetical protein C3F09_01105 [candidate division GN15 bacterium]|uniref:DUF4402 domain-containing protein n=1 Tax=candidate division GN15 bacterium TaxID=2072418 RepID=A0A855X4H9_9BACT|nr:MAG: hypothetical protein C3F09_01105 [candidate division GN15 bacterium]